MGGYNGAAMSRTRIHRTTPLPGVLLAEMDRPPVNAYDDDLLGSLASLVGEAASDEQVRVLVLGSRLPGVFSAGADLGVFLAVEAERRPDLCARCRDVQAALRACPRPVLALLEGMCLGGGAGIALAAVKESVTRGLRASLEEGLAVELEQVRGRFLDPGVDEFMAAALGRRGEGPDR